MDLYADFLAEGLMALDHDQIDVQVYQPRLPIWCQILPQKFNLRMRAARYIDYPLRAKAYEGNINHIIEDGYAQLMSSLDPARTVVTVHDLIPLLAWRGAIPGMTYPHRPRLYEHSLKALKKAAHVITISHSTKKNLIDHCGLAAERISVIYYGIGHNFFPLPTNEQIQAKRSFGLIDDDIFYILIAGHQSYKNHYGCLKAIEIAQAKTSKPLQLVKQGLVSEEWKKHLAQVQLDRPVISIDRLKLMEMAKLYNAVDCLLFPSFYEGFGRPPLEAMACGTPVITSNVASLPEFVEGVGLMASPDDHEALADALVRIVENDELRQIIIQKGLDKAAFFTWEKNINQTIDVYRSLIG